MTEKDFVMWIKGFVTACHEYAPTPKQWDQLKEVLGTVGNSTPSSYIYTPPDSSTMSSSGDTQILND